MTALPLVFDAPKRALPPRHFADLEPAERRAAVTELGLPAFRADQIARHYFGHFTADLATMTDLPSAARESLAALLPPLVTPVKELACDDGATRKTLWAATAAEVNVTLADERVRHPIQRLLEERIW